MTKKTFFIRVLQWLVAVAVAVFLFTSFLPAQESEVMVYVNADYSLVYGGHSYTVNFHRSRVLLLKQNGNYIESGVWEQHNDDIKITFNGTIFVGKVNSFGDVAGFVSWRNQVINFVCIVSGVW